MIRVDHTSSRRSRFSLLGVMIALLVCVGLMTHVASIDADSTVAAASVVSLDDQLNATISTDLAPSAAQWGPGTSFLELCALLGVLCLLMQLVLLGFRSLRRRLVHIPRPQPNTRRVSLLHPSDLLGMLPAPIAPLRL